MRPIPPEMRQELAYLPRMKECTLLPVSDLYEACRGRIEWHHVWTYAGRQINELWAILAACHHHHRLVGEQRAVRMAFEAASLYLATPEDLAKYPKKNWAQIKKLVSVC